MLTIVIVILIVVTAASITALFLRGFTIDDLTDQFKNQSLTTPTKQVWLVQTTGYDDKMDAYKAGIAAAGNDWGVYVLPDNGKWTWVAGVYTTAEESDEALKQSGLPTNASSKLYQITGKSFQLAPDAAVACGQVLTAVENVFNLLLDLRTAINKAADSGNLILDLTAQYNQIKGSSETLQTLNANLQNQFVATVIYTANQNILSLQDIVCSDANHPVSLAQINTALLKTIFSLDNF